MLYPSSVDFTRRFGKALPATHTEKAIETVRRLLNAPDMKIEIFHEPFPQLVTLHFPGDHDAAKAQEMDRVLCRAIGRAYDNTLCGGFIEGKHVFRLTADAFTRHLGGTLPPAEIAVRRY